MQRVLFESYVKGRPMYPSELREDFLKFGEDGAKANCKSRDLSEAGGTSRNNTTWQSIMDEKPTQSPGLDAQFFSYMS